MREADPSTGAGPGAVEAEERFLLSELEGEAGVTSSTSQAQLHYQTVKGNPRPSGNLEQDVCAVDV